jgi:ABC-type branched-subunit amino acid transport system permease subunit
LTPARRRKYGGPDGPPWRGTRERGVYWLALCAGVGAVLAVYLILRSRLGLALTAIRDKEAGAPGA